MVLPAQLLARLDDGDVVALQEFALKVANRLPQVYDENVMDHQESRGDDGPLFGFKVYKHLRFAMMQDVEDLPDVAFVEDNGAYYIAIGPLSIRLDSLGILRTRMSCTPSRMPVRPSGLSAITTQRSCRWISRRRDRRRRPAPMS
jgi:hypothetical protein